MNKRQIIASLKDIANTLDNSGLYKEANSITNIMKRLALFEKTDFSDLEERFKQEDAAPLPVKINKLVNDKGLLDKESGHSQTNLLGQVIKYFESPDKESFKSELIKPTGRLTGYDYDRRVERILRFIDEIEYFQLRDNLSDEEMVQGIEDYYNQFISLDRFKQE